MEFDVTLIHSVGKIAVTIIVLLAFFLFTVKSHIKQANYLFAGFLLLVAFDLCGLFMYEWLNAHPLIDLIRRTSSLIQMPMIYFYVLTICYQDFKLDISLIKHAFPFLFLWLLFLPRFMPLDTAEKSQFLQDTNNFELITKQMIGELQYFFYIIVILKTLANYQKLYQENYASFDQTAHQWLFQMTVISVLAHLFAMTKDIMTYFANPELVLMAHLLVSLIVLSVISWLVLKALHHPSITRGISSIQKSIVLPQTEISASQPLSAEAQEQLHRLKSLMETNEPYLDADLTIEDLAELSAMPSKELSALININLGQNFFNFINNYRIQKAKTLLENPDNKKMSVLEILYRVGFNSKSSFNTAFKRYTGQTPTAYRNKALKAS